MFTMLPASVGQVGGGPVVYAAWNPADKNAAIQLANSNTRAQLAAAGTLIGIARSDKPIVGKRYFELDMVFVSTGAGMLGGGIATSSAPLSDDPGDNALSVGFFLSNLTVYFSGGSAGFLPGSIPSAGTYRFGIAVDSTARKVWARLNGNAFYGDPVAGTGEIAIISGSSQIYAAAAPKVRTSTLVNAVDLISNPSLFTGAIPSGFTGGIS